MLLFQNDEASEKGEEERTSDLQPAIERTILVLYHQEERSYEQIAEVLRIPIGTVGTHLHRGRKKMRKGIERTALHEVRR